MEKVMESDNFVIWQLKKDFDNALITESDMSYYRARKEVDPSVTVIVTTSERRVKQISWGTD
jgi:hypothetical protein